MIRIDRLLGSVPPDLDCGETAQNEFLRDEAVYAQNEGLSATHVAYSAEGRAVGYVTLAMGSVRFEAHERPRAASVSVLPALLVAQLGVSTDQHGRGIGSLLIRFATGIAQSLRHSIGCRYVVVDCLPVLAGYYARFGFRESKGEKRQRTATIKRLEREEVNVPVRLSLDIATRTWREIDVAPPHLYATELHRAAGEGDIALLNFPAACRCACRYPMRSRR